MPNYNKSFNFRNGVQVDVDDLIVRGNLVGIGTTIPRADLDVRGIVDVIGIVTTSNLFVSGVSTFANELHIGTGITISPQTGIISASFRGDGSFLDNLPTSQWSNDGSGGIYNGGPVGVGTTNATQTFQVGGNPDNPLHFGVGIDSARGNIRTTGIITAASFVGSGLGITAITADNITSGNLDSARLPTSFFGLGEIGATNLAISGVGTVATINSTTGTITTLSATNATVSNDLNVGGALTATSLNVSGVSTLTGGLRVPGGTGVSNRAEFGNSQEFTLQYNTVSTRGLISAATDPIDIQATTIRLLPNAGQNGVIVNQNGSVELYHSNSKRFETTGVGATVVGKLQVSSDSSILGISTLTSVSASDATIGVSTLTNVTATDIAVQKLTVSGVTTFAAAVDANAGATIDNIQIGISDDNEIDTASGNLTIDSAGGTTTVDDNLSVSGTVSISDNTSITGSLDINGGVAVTGILTVSSQINPTTTNTVGLGTAGTAYSDAFIGDITVGDATSSTITTRNESLILDSAQGTVIVQDDFNVTGVSTLSTLAFNDGILTGSTSFRPTSDKSAGIGTNGTSFSEGFFGEVTVGAASSNKISTREGSLLLDSTQGTVIVQDDFSVTGVSTLTSLIVNSATVTTATVDINLIPSSDKSAGIGTNGTSFSEGFFGEITIGSASDNTVSSRSGSLLLDSTQGTVVVQDDFSVTGVTTLTSLTVGTSLVPTSDKSNGIGAVNQAFSNAFVGEVTVGAALSNKISTREGSLLLDSTQGTVIVQDDFNVTGVTTLTSLTVDSSLVPTSDKSNGIGAVNRAFSNAFVGEVTVGAASSNKVSTRGGSLLLDSTQGTVIVQDDFNVTGVSTLPTLNSTTITSTNINASTTLSPVADKTVPLGSSSLRYSELYVDNIRVGVGSDQEIKAQTGNLEIDAPFGRVRVNNLTPVGIVTFAGDISLDGDKTRNLGSGTNALASGHIGEVRIANGTNDNTIDTRTGELILNSAEDRVIVGSGLSAPSLDITNNILVGSGSTSFAVLSGVQNVGIGTSIPSSSIQVVKHSDANLQLISKTASSGIILASELGTTDDSASIVYDGTNLSLSNRDSAGDILVNMSFGTGINTTSKFKIIHDSSDLFVVSHDGLLGINKSVPTKELDIAGDLLVSDNATIVGVLTVGTGTSQFTFGSGDTVLKTNIDTSNSSGVSTITTLNSTSITSGNINSSGIITAVTGNFTGNISVANTGTFNNGTFLVGGTIGTDAQSFVAATGGDVLTVRGATSIRGNLFAAYAGGQVGIGTTNFPEDGRSDNHNIGNLVEANYGNFSHTGDVSFIGSQDNGTCIFVPSKNDPTIATLKKNNSQSEFSWTREFKVGINTYVPRSAFDIGACNSPMIVPSLSQQSITELVTVPNDSTMISTSLSSGSGTQVIGGLFFSKPENRLKVGLATANSEDSYVGILTATTNSSAFEAVSFPQMTTTNRNTMNTAGGIPDGSVIYNTTTNKLQVKAGGSFVDLH